jgi:hypothetical protein
MAYSNGSMRELIAIEGVTRTADGGGGFTNAWSTSQSVYAHAVQTPAQNLTLRASYQKKAHGSLQRAMFPELQRLIESIGTQSCSIFVA